MDIKKEPLLLTLNENLRGRNQYDFEFNTACKKTDFKRVVTLSENHHCNNYKEGLYAICLGQWDQQNDVKETMDFLFLKLNLLDMDSFMDDLLLKSMQTNNIKTITYLFELLRKNALSPTKYRMILKQKSKDVIDGAITSGYINSHMFLTLRNIFSEVLTKKWIEDFTQFVRNESYKDRDEKLCELTMKFSDIIFYESNIDFFQTFKFHIVESGFYLPIKMFLNEGQKRKMLSKMKPLIALGGNLETFKLIEQEYKMKDKLLVLNLHNSFKTSNPKGLELIKYLESKVGHIYKQRLKPPSGLLSTMSPFDAIVDLNIIRYTVEKYSEILNPKTGTRMDIFVQVYEQFNQSELQLFLYDKLVKHYSDDEFFEQIGDSLFENDSYELQKELSKRPKYYEYVFTRGSMEYFELYCFICRNKIYEIVFSDVKNIHKGFDFEMFITSMFGDITMQQEDVDTTIFLKNFMIKNNIQLIPLLYTQLLKKLNAYQEVTKNVLEFDMYVFKFLLVSRIYTGNVLGFKEFTYLNDFSHNTLYDVFHYLYKIMPTTKQIQQMWEEKYPTEIFQSKDECMNKYPNFRNAYNRYLEDKGLTYSVLRDSPISNKVGKDVHMMIMKYL